MAGFSADKLSRSEYPAAQKRMARVLAGTDLTFEIGNDGRIRSNFSYTKITADYTATLGDQIILSDSTSANVEITLPAAKDGHIFLIKDISGSANTTLITPDGTETIDGGASHTLQGTTFDAIVFIGGESVGGGGTDWWIFSTI